MTNLDALSLAVILIIDRFCLAFHIFTIFFLFFLSCFILWVFFSNFSFDWSSCVRYNLFSQYTRLNFTKYTKDIYTIIRLIFVSWENVFLNRLCIIQIIINQYISDIFYSKDITVIICLHNFKQCWYFKKKKLFTTQSNNFFKAIFQNRKITNNLKNILICLLHHINIKLSSKIFEFFR